MLPVLLPQFPILINGEYMFSVPLRDGAKSVIDLFNQIRIVEEAANCRDRIMFVSLCFVIRFPPVSGSSIYPNYTELP